VEWRGLLASVDEKAAMELQKTGTLLTSTAGLTI
jgi:hypothetical protein